MKTKEVLLFTTLSIILSMSYSYGQTGSTQNLRILYYYDNSGNRISRDIVLEKPIKQFDNIGETNGDSLALRNYEESSKEDLYYSDKFGSEDVRIYPNPTRGQLKVEFFSPVDHSSIRLSVFCSAGKLVYRQTMLQNPEVIDMSNQVNGIYLMVIENDTSRITWRIIKQ